MPVLILLVMIIAIVIVFMFYPKWQDQRIVKSPFPNEWQKIVDRRIPFFSKLNGDMQKQLQSKIKLFIAKKDFSGCGGLVINDEIRVTIAAEACLLLLNRKAAVYPSLRYILVYPSAFKKNGPQQHEDGTVSHAETGLLGESWSNGKVILSWDDVESGIADFNDGNNVVLHEFAHQLDSASGVTNGAPILRKNSYQTWSKAFSTEFEGLIEARNHQYKAVMDYYGATNPAEFFAVATETFFEKPAQMSTKHPELFEELKTYYCVDPRTWE